MRRVNRDESREGSKKEISNQEWGIVMRLSMVFLTVVTAVSTASAGAIPCDKINLQGSYRLKIDDGIYSDFREYAERYFENDYVKFSELLDTETKIIQFYPSPGSLDLNDEAAAVKTNANHKEIQKMDASVVAGKRGGYCSLEISGTKLVDGKEEKFSEYYLVLALSYKNKNDFYFWLGHPNETDRKYAYYKLTKINSSHIALNP